MAYKEKLTPTKDGFQELWDSMHHPPCRRHHHEVRPAAVSQRPIYFPKMHRLSVCTIVFQSRQLFGATFLRSSPKCNIFHKKDLVN